MPTPALTAALRAVNWSENIDDFTAEDAPSEAVEAGNVLLATWSRQFEIADRGNPALSFVREMQVAGHHVAAMIALALYKGAAGAMRTMCDTALYYSYFRTHPEELGTLVRDTSFYMEKKEIIEYHKQHTPFFPELQNRLALISRLDQWYSFTSGVIHGQLPGTWAGHRSLSEIRFSKMISSEVVDKFQEGVDVVHRLFLCTTGRALWHDFSRTAKRRLLSGLSGEVKTALGLDSA